MLFSFPCRAFSGRRSPCCLERWRYRIFMLHHHPIAPHFFQPIKFSCFFLKDMNHHIYIINQHPLQRLVSFMAIRKFITGFANLFFDGVSDGFHLCICTRFANDEKICNSFRYFQPLLCWDCLRPFCLSNLSTPCCWDRGMPRIWV